MNYFEMINQMVEDSNMTLKEIAYKCEDYGVKVNPSYISKLKSGKQAPASDEINRAIAKACGFEDQIENLLFESYMEKAPTYIKEFLTDILAMFKNTIKESSKNIVPEYALSFLEAQVNSLSNFDIIKQTLKQKNNIKNIVPKEKNVIFKMEDNTMEPLIPEGATLHLDFDTEVKNGDVVVLKNNEGFLVRRLFKENNSAFLISEKGEKQFIIKEDNIDVIGIVRFITIQL